MDPPAEDLILGVLRKRIRLSRTEAASAGRCSTKWADKFLQAWIDKGLLRWDPPRRRGEKGGYVHVLREVETLLARQAWAEGIVKTLDPRERQLTEEEYEAYRQASRWRRELPSGPELMGMVPVKRSEPRWKRDESLRRKYRELVGLGLDPEEAEAAVKSAGVAGGKGVSSEEAEAVLRWFGVEQSPP